MIIDRLQELIRIPSYSGQEQPVQDFIKSELEKSGAHPFMQNHNLVLHLTGQDSSRAFIFNGHVDVVSIGDESRWLHDPWSGVVEGDRIYGRGSTDMKSGIAAMMAVSEVISQKDNLPTDVWFTFVANEETDGSGTESFAQWFQEQGFQQQYQEIGAIFAEPTQLTSAHFGHQGNFFLKAEIVGDSGHSSNPKLIKVQAIQEMAGFLQQLQKENVRWTKKHNDPHFPPPSIVATSFESKSGSPNKTPSHAEATLDLRTIPGFHQEAFDRIKLLAARRNIALSNLYSPAPYGYTSLESKVVQTIKQLLPHVKLEIFPGSTDLGFLTEIGAEGIIFGPGDMAVAHADNEFVIVDQVLSAPNMYLDFYKLWSEK